MKVRALETYAKMNIQDDQLKRIPQAGEVFEVDSKRLNILLGDNKYKAVFVELVDKETKPVDKETKPVEKATKPKKNVEKR